MDILIPILVFIVAALVGYRFIKQVPSLLHTPLMSGMNALSGITILGALASVVLLMDAGYDVLAMLLGGIAVAMATINVVGGFFVTGRMLKMFKKKEGKHGTPS